MQIPISTTLTLTNYSGIVQDNIIGLLQASFQGVQTIGGLRPAFGNPDPVLGPIKFPCFMVDVGSLGAKMDRVGKWERKYHAMILFYVTGQNQEALKQKQLAYAEGLIKLFSNNAASAGQPNGQYKNFDPYWWNSEFDGDIILSKVYTSPQNQNEYVRAWAAKMWFVASVIE
jgi:hypothetical protein